FPQTSGQLDAAHRAVFVVLLPARAGEVAARHALDLNHAGALDQHRAAFELIAKSRKRVRIVRDSRGEKVVGSEVAQEIEPEDGKLGQHLAFIGDAGAQDVVESGNAVGGHDEQPAVDLV